MLTEAMIMAAGLGTRLQPFTQVMPKPFLPLMGVPAIQFLVDSLLQSHVRQLSINVHHLPETARMELNKIEFPMGKWNILDESKQLLGSAGGIGKALQSINGDAFFLANGDVLYDLNWNELYAHHEKLKRKWGVTITCVLCQKSQKGEKYNEVLLDSAGERIVGFGGLKEECSTYVGAAVIEKTACYNIPASQPSGFIPCILEPAILHGRAGAMILKGAWEDFGSPLTWHRAHFSMMDRLEKGMFHSTVSQGWRHRLETVNQRVADRLWIAKQSPVAQRMEWVGPSYWDGRGCNESPKKLGPGTILYGFNHLLEHKQDFSKPGIFYGKQKWNLKLN